VRILIVSFFYPPTTSVGTVGAARVGNTSIQLAAAGHEVRVLSALSGVSGEGAQLAGLRLHRTPWHQVNALPKAVLAALSRRSRSASQATAPASVGGAEQPELKGAARVVQSLYTGLTNVPDETVGWVLPALQEGRRLLSTFRPDVIFASGAPFSAFVVAQSLARTAGCPWVAELRDLWVDNHYYRFAGWRKAIDRRIEAQLLSHAAGIVTVSEPLAETLRARYLPPVEVIIGGFDPASYPSEAAERSPEVLRLLYAGRLYGERRDPRPLLQALSLLGDDASRVRLDFYLSAGQGYVRELAEQAGVGACVHVHEPRPHAEILKLETAADVLVLLLWNHPEERGVFTGKFFEYLGAKRPVLALAPDFNVAASTIAEHGLGLASLDPQQIAHWLRARLADKARGQHPALSDEAVADFSRSKQVARLMTFLQDIVSSSAAS